MRLMAETARKGREKSAMIDAYIFEAGWLFFVAWSVIVAVAVILAFGKDVRLAQALKSRRRASGDEPANPLAH
jgi:hypothetical protein